MCVAYIEMEKINLSIPFVKFSTLVFDLGVTSHDLSLSGEFEKLLKTKITFTFVNLNKETDCVPNDVADVVGHIRSYIWSTDRYSLPHTSGHFARGATVAFSAAIDEVQCDVPEWRPVQGTAIVNDCCYLILGPVFVLQCRSGVVSPFAIITI